MNAPVQVSADSSSAAAMTAPRSADAQTQAAAAELFKRIAESFAIVKPEALFPGAAADASTPSAHDAMT